MINAKINSQCGKASIEISGNIPTIMSDIAILIREIYEEIRSNNEDMADTFKKLVCDEIGIAFMDEEELMDNVIPQLKDNNIKKKMKQLKELNELLSQLNELFDEEDD